jgi:hypothetical protein
MSGAHHSTIEWSLQNFRAVVVPQQSLIEIKLLGFVHTNSGRFDAPLKVHDCPTSTPKSPQWLLEATSGATSLVFGQCR